MVRRNINGHNAPHDRLEMVYGASVICCGCYLGLRLYGTGDVAMMAAPVGGPGCCPNSEASVLICQTEYPNLQICTKFHVAICNLH